MPEAHPAEPYLRPLPPQVLQQLDQLHDPFVVAVRVVHAPRDQDRSRVLRYLFDRGDVPSVVGTVFHHVVHTCLDSKSRVVLHPCLCEQFAQYVPEASLLRRRVRMRFVCLEDEHSDDIALHIVRCDCSIL